MNALVLTVGLTGAFFGLRAADMELNNKIKLTRSQVEAKVRANEARIESQSDLIDSKLSAIVNSLDRLEDEIGRLRNENG